VGGGILFQRLETHDGFDHDLAQAQPTPRRSRLQGLGLHPPPLGETLHSDMISTEQLPFSLFSPLETSQPKVKPLAGSNLKLVLVFVVSFERFIVIIIGLNVVNKKILHFL
jgi:hypothetical protein